METHDTPEKTYDLERLIFFSDGVFAIVITLLAIELHPPANWDRTLAGLWHAEWRSFVAYGVSFLAVGGYWNGHRRVFARIVKFHPGLVAFNMLLLALVVLVPFANQLTFESGPRGEPFAILLGLISVIGVAQALLWGYAAFVAKVVDDRVTQTARVIGFVATLAAPGAISALFLAVVNGLLPDAVMWALIPLALGFAVVRRRVFAKPAS